MDENYKNKILEEIKKSGFPLELELSEQLRYNNILTFSNTTFTSIENQVHEIDLMSMIFNEENEWANGPCGINLIIECKKTEKYPWIFFNEGYNPLNALGMLFKADFFTDFKDGEAEFNPLIGCMNSIFSQHHYNDHSKPITKTYFEAFKKPNEPTSIYKAVSNIFYARQFIKRWLKESTNATVEKGRTFINYYLVVLDGDLFVAEKEEGIFDINATDHVLLTAIDTLEKGKVSLTDNEIIIDVITKQYFPEYLKVIKNEAKNFNEHLRMLENSRMIKLNK